MHYFSFCITSLFFLLLNIGWLLFDVFYGLYHEHFLLFWNDASFSFGIDGISLPFIYLTLLFGPLCILYNWHYSTHIRSEYAVLLLLVQVSLLLFFMTSNLLLFFFLFECLLFPFFLMFGIRALRTRKAHAAFLLLLYTIIGSLALLSGVLALYSRTGSLDLFMFICTANSRDGDVFLCGLFLFSFVTKIPIVPFHNWLPEAHVEAPTEISVILAGVILKIGTYGILRVVLPIFSSAFYYLVPIMLIISLLSVCYSSLTALSQSDIKKIIAYSSIAHMNVSVIGVCCAKLIPMCGSIFLMFSHGIVSGGLFFLIGMVYERYGTKIVKYYTGLTSIMPVFSAAFFLLILGNTGFPLTCGFIGEALILVGVVETGNSLLFCGVVFSIFIAALYSIWLYNKIFFGVPSIPFIGDMTYRESIIIVPILLDLLLFGLFPNILLEHIYSSVLVAYSL